ncbi:hypothetical protein C7H19_23175 [Aphanothece hegewaldii CCALA 016]|uniref:Uncharacterized protein n=1 Tax=Aphanothece hegewaldii CCALA 016 TaxID=2107694 RepID=A0A2T1LRL7_9CHRO|nr:hypothetical protein [Aphanothece hegewaldii]PSF31164.1 hypothetical protein C7H19_23175 [Aphanothece hegewaldii CCALA 016]
MSRLAINQYYSEVDRIIQYGGTRKESSLEIAFQNPLNSYCKTRDFMLMPKLDYCTKISQVIYFYDIVKNILILNSD